MPVQIDSRLHCKMCHCTMYAILTVRLLHYHHITVFIHNSGHFGPPSPFWTPAPPALPGLPMSSYATGAPLTERWSLGSVRAVIAYVRLSCLPIRRRFSGASSSRLSSIVSCVSSDRDQGLNYGGQQVPTFVQRQAHHTSTHKNPITQ